jgi:hypothetical protein
MKVPPRSRRWWEGPGVDPERRLRDLQRVLVDQKIAVRKVMHLQGRTALVLEAAGYVAETEREIEELQAYLVEQVIDR